MYVSKSVKVLFIVFILTMVSFRVLATGGTIREDGLLGYWSFDDLPVDTTPASGTVFYDVSGNERHGTLHNDTECVKGIVGNALKFNGLSSYAKIPYNTGLSSPEAFSIEAWVYPTPPHQNGHNGGIICNINGREYNRILIRYDNNKLLGYFSVRPPEGSATAIEPDGPLITNMAWNHVVLTCDGIAGKIIMYVNGVAGVMTSFTGDVLTANYDLTLGWGHTGDNYHYNGLIDEVKIYNRVLSPQEIEAKYKLFDKNYLILAL